MAQPAVDVQEEPLPNYVSKDKGECRLHENEVSDEESNEEKTHTFSLNTQQSSRPLFKSQSGHNAGRTLERLLTSLRTRINKLEKNGMKIFAYQLKSPLSVLRKFNGMLQSDTKRINTKGLRGSLLS